MLKKFIFHRKEKATKTLEREKKKIRITIYKTVKNTSFFFTTQRSIHSARFYDELLLFQLASVVAQDWFDLRAREFGIEREGFAAYLPVIFLLPDDSRPIVWEYYDRCYSTIPHPTALIARRKILKRKDLRPSSSLDPRYFTPAV